MIELPTIPGYGNGVGSFGSSRYIPSLDLAFAEDKAFTVNTASPGNASITSRRGPSANFLRQSGATFINDQGLIEYAPENLVIHSENPSNVNWSKIDAVAVTATTEPTPTGSLNAYRIDATSSSNGIITSAGSQPTGASTVTGSVWLKASSPVPFNTFISFRDATNTLILEQSITITSEWQRFSITGNIGNNSVVRVGVGGNSTFNYGKSFYIWGAQVERASTARTYYPTTTSVFYAPRFDHDPVTGDSKGLLIEEPRTNLCLRSEELGSGVWAIFGSSISSDSVISPNGTVSADSLVENTSLSFHSVYQNLSVVGATVYTFSIYAKAGTREWISLLESTPNRRTFFNLSTGAVGQKNAAHTTSVQQLGNGWWRFAITFTAVSSASVPFAAELASADGVGSYLGNGSGNIYLWGAQLETGAFPTSYIPTTSGTAARSADVCSIVGDAFASFYNQSEGTFLSSASQPIITTANALVYGVDNGSDSSRFHMNHNTSIAISQSSGVTQSFFDMANPLANELSKVAYVYKINDYSAFRNATQGTSASNGTVPTVDRINFGSTPVNLSRILNGHIARIQYFRKRLSNAKLQALTAP